MAKINIQVLTQAGQASVSCIKERVLCEIIFRIEPFLFQLSPNRLRNVQMRGIRRQKEKEQSPVLPVGNSLLNGLSLVQAGIVQYNECIFVNLKRKIFQIFQYKLCIDVFFGSLPITLALSVNYTKTVYLIRFFAQNANLFIRELPTIRNIAFAAYMRFVSIIKVYFGKLAQFFKFSKTFNTVLVIFRQRASLTTKSYPFISSANLFKKLRNVSRLTDLPLEASHSALAVCKRWRFALMASKIADLSSDSLIMGLRPRPGFVANPAMPSDLNRLSQLFTLTLHMPVMRPTSADVLPSALRSMLWQRIRKQWLAPCFSPNSNDWHCADVRTGVLTRPIMGTKLMNNKN